MCRSAPVLVFETHCVCVCVCVGDGGELSSNCIQVPLTCPVSHTIDNTDSISMVTQRTKTHPECRVTVQHVN